jgi:hypothetical protein
MIVLAFFGGILVLMLAAAVIYDHRARRRGLRPGVPSPDVAKRTGSDFPYGGDSVGGGGLGGP